MATKTNNMELLKTFEDGGLSRSGSSWVGMGVSGYLLTPVGGPSISLFVVGHFDTGHFVYTQNCNLLDLLLLRSVDGLLSLFRKLRFVLFW